MFSMRVGALLIAERQADPLEQTEQARICLDFHPLEHFIGREVLNTNDEILAERTELTRQPAEGRDRDDLKDRRAKGRRSSALRVVGKIRCRS